MVCPNPCQQRVNQAASIFGWDYPLPSHQLTWKCRNRIPFQEESRLTGVCAQTHVSWEGTRFLEPSPNQSPPNYLIGHLPWGQEGTFWSSRILILRTWRTHFLIYLGRWLAMRYLAEGQAPKAREWMAFIDLHIFVSTSMYI